jgi:hypothetical protein
MSSNPTNNDTFGCVVEDRSADTNEYRAAMSNTLGRVDEAGPTADTNECPPAMSDTPGRVDEAGPTSDTNECPPAMSDTPGRVDEGPTADTNECPPEMSTPPVQKREIKMSDLQKREIRARSALSQENADIIKQNLKGKSLYKDDTKVYCSKRTIPDDKDIFGND